MAGPRVKYEADRRSMRAFLSSPEMARIVEAVARKGQAAARALAPRDTGDYGKLTQGRRAGLSRPAARGALQHLPYSRPDRSP